MSGTITSLAGAEPYTSFYWKPSVTNYPGVDGVLGDTRGNIYAVQATVANDHTSPVEGLRKLWRDARGLRSANAWHVVVVADTQETMVGNVAKFSADMADKTFGRNKITMKVWGCVLERN